VDGSETGETLPGTTKKGSNMSPTISAPAVLLDQPRPDELVQAHPGALHLHPPRTRPLQQLAQLNLSAVELAPGYALALTRRIEIMKSHKTSPF